MMWLGRSTICQQTWLGNIDSLVLTLILSSKVIVPIILCLLVITGFLGIGTFLFHHWEVCLSSLMKPNTHIL